MTSNTSVFDDLAPPITSPTTPRAPTAIRDAQPPSSTSAKNSGYISSMTTSNEQNYDLFSTLFAPSTPHASPILGPTQPPPEEPKFRKPPPQPFHHRSASMSSQGSDFGAFVSVSSSDDPLSTDFDDFEGLQEPMTATPSNAHVYPATVTDADTRRRGLARSISRASSSSRSTSQSLRGETDTESNPTLSYFDQFAQEAKQRSNKRSSLLNELLLHEDDPLYFLNTPSSPKPPPPVALQPDLVSSPEPIQVSQSTTTLRPASPLPSSNTSPLPISNITPIDSLATLNDEFDFTHDVDNHYFRVAPSSSVLRPTPYSPPQSHAPPSAPGSRLVPTRSPSISVAEPKPAAPITSAEFTSRSPSMSASSLHSLDPSLDDPGLFDEEESGKSRLTRAQSSSSLSNSLSALPGKWMATFMRTPAQGGGGGARPALESIFQDPRMHAEPHHAQTLPAQPTFTHTSAFAASPPPSGLPATSSSLFSSSTLTHGASPFAPHVYVPPSGAPGYAGEGYGGRMWDKGYSEELEQEMRNSHLSPGVPSPLQGQPATSPRGTATYSERGDQAPASGGRGGWGSGFGFGFGSRRGQSVAGPDPSSVVSRATSLPGLDNKTGIAKSNSAPMMGSGGEANGNGNGGMGAFIEKKTGKVELLGRKELTTPVLTPELATDLRPNFPALARLPKSWTLIYSLDQNGISLNTLYSRCEAHASRRPVPGEVLNTSMLVAVKDADGAVFGVWLADGIRGGKGGRGYFGGGESFLWKCHHDELKVFKCTGKNSYVALCEPEYISFGGGDGHYGLYLDDTLFDGSSAPCPTFNNEPLCSPGPKKGATVTFECVGLEIWGMGP